MVIEEELPSPLVALQGEQARISGEENEQETNAYERVKAYLVRSPEASVREIAVPLAMGPSTAHKWRGRMKETRMTSQ